MALIGSIRKHSWVPIVVIGIGLLGFLAMDMFSGKQSMLGGGGQTTIGEVNGSAIDYRNFERSYDAVYAGSAGDMYQQRAGLWNYMVEDQLIRDEARELGLGVPADELEDLLYGTNPSPIIQQRFRDQQSGQLNREVLNSYRDAEQNGGMAQVDPTRRRFWQYQKTEINKQRLQDKLAALVSKAMYTPDWQAEAIAKGQNTRLDLAYVKVPYTAIDDASVQLADADYEAYMEEEGARYRRDEDGREVAYVAFEVAPTLADSAAIRTRLDTIKSRWADAEADSAFVLQNRGQFPGSYFTEEQLPEQVRGADTGTIVGPYLDAGSYTITKVVDQMTVPDSVRSRHILLAATTQEEYAAAQSLADSLTQLLEAGTNTFEELAREFSTGPTGPKGGDLGYVAPGSMVGPFNDLIFYQAEEGEINQVLTQFGLHVVEVTGRKVINDNQGLRTASISEAIEPSSETQDAIREQANEFARNNRTLEAMKTAAEADPVLEFEDGIIVGENDFVVGELGSSQASRDMIKYAYKASAGDVSPQVYDFRAPNAFYDQRYVVLGVGEEVDEGIPSWKAIRSTIEPAVTQRKKTQLVSEQVGGADLNAIAARYEGSTTDTARAINFGSTFVPSLGSEPKVLAQAFSLPLNTTSAPITGQSGVFVVRPLTRTEPGDEVTANLDNIRLTQNTQIGSQASARLAPALRGTAEVEDSRARFY